MSAVPPLQRETLRKHRVLRDLVQQFQEPQHLLQRIQSVSRLRGEPLQCPDGGRRHSKPLEAAFGNVDRNDDVPASRRPCRPGFRAPRIARPGGRERPEILESFAWHAKPLPLAIQPETHRVGGCGVATRASVSDQRDRVDTRHQIERVDKLLGVAVQLQGRVIGNDAARAQPRRRQEAVNGPVACVRVLGHGREHTADSHGGIAMQGSRPLYSRVVG